MPALARQWQLPFPLDVRLVLSVHRRGGGDPAYAVDPAGAVWRTSLTPDGPGTLRVLSRSAEVPGSTLVTGQAWGPGAGWLLDHVPAQLGGQDDRSGFTARDPVVGELMRRHQDLRVGRSDRVFEALVPAVLEQKVVDRLLMLVGRDQPARAKMELLRGLRGDPDEGRVARPGRTVADLLDAAAELRMERRRQAEAQAAAREALRERQREAARQRHLDQLAKEPEAAWPQDGKLIGTKVPRS